jgi:hypothetical protein
MTVPPLPRTTVMTLLEALRSADMLLIDTLHAFDFSLDQAGGLSLECMDGRELKRWTFTPAQVAAAEPQAEANTFVLESASGPARLTCLEAFSATPDDDDPPEEPEQA